MKKIISICIGFILFLWITMFLASCTPVRYVYVDQKDSVVKKQRVIYDNLYMPSPFIFNYGWGIPYYYRPVIIQRHRPIVVPQRPIRPAIQPNRWHAPQRTFPTRPVRPNR